MMAWKVNKWHEGILCTRKNLLYGAMVMQSNSIKIVHLRHPYPREKNCLISKPLWAIADLRMQASAVFSQGRHHASGNTNLAIWCRECVNFMREAILAGVELFVCLGFFAHLQRKAYCAEQAEQQLKWEIS